MEKLKQIVDIPFIAETVVFIAFIILITSVIIKINNVVFKKIVKKSIEKGKDTTFLGFLRYLLLAIIYFAAVITVITSIKPMQTMIKSLLAGSGIAALVIGLASQEAVGNIVSGFLILAFKPFVKGDMIRYVDKNIVGTVEDITLRHTTIKTAENKRIIVPNGIINKEVLENYNYIDEKVCVFLEVGISYESDIEKAMSIIKTEIQKHPDCYDNRENNNDEEIVVVRVIELAESSVKLRAWVWALNPTIAFNLKCDLYKNIKMAFDINNVDIAYPHITVVKK